VQRLHGAVGSSVAARGDSSPFDIIHPISSPQEYEMFADKMYKDESFKSAVVSLCVLFKSTLCCNFLWFTITMKSLVMLKNEKCSSSARPLPPAWL